MEARRLSIVHVPTSRHRWKNPVLFVPGAFTGAWLWKDTFMPYAAAHGFDAWAVTFRSHDRSGWLLHSLGLRDYLEDLQSAVDRLPAKPVLVAHSLGAWVTYHFARQYAPKALILVSPVPADGILSLFRTRSLERSQAGGDSPIPSGPLAWRSSGWRLLGRRRPSWCGSVYIATSSGVLARFSGSLCAVALNETVVVGAHPRHWIHRRRDRDS